MASAARRERLSCRRDLGDKKMDAVIHAMTFGRCRYGRFGGPAFSGVHAIVVALMRQRVTGAIICLMGALGLVGWTMTYVL
jgi:hypothetical protein